MGNTYSWLVTVSVHSLHVDLNRFHFAPWEHGGKIRGLWGGKAPRKIPLFPYGKAHQKRMPMFPNTYIHLKIELSWHTGVMKLNFYTNFRETMTFLNPHLLPSS